MLKKFAPALLSGFIGVSGSPALAQEPATNAPEAEACAIDVDLRQSRFSLNPFSHLKDAMNAVQFKIPVACDEIENLPEGTNLVENFRAGSLLVDGSLSSWDLTVDEAPIQPANPDPSSCTVELRLYQSRFSLDIFQHIKDAANAVEFEWNIPESIYNQTAIGDDYIDDGFRMGSLLIRQSAGKWNLDVTDKLGCGPS